MEKRNLVPLKVAKARIGCGQTKVYELINAGVIVAYKMGFRTMVDVDSIDAYHASLPRIEPKEGA